MRTKTQQELIDILRFEIRGIPLPEGFSVSDEDALISIARIHDLTHLVYDALTKNGLPCKSSFAMQQYYAAIWRAEQMAHELESLSKLFEEEGTDFMPLKGAVMRPLYPEPWMRTSADIDILFRENDMQRAVELAVEKLGYSKDTDDISSHHDLVIAPNNNVHVEMHHVLFADFHLGEKIRSVMDEVWDNGPMEGSVHRFVMSDAMFYFYHVAHMAKHMVQSGGCPIRGIVDLWILNGLADRKDKKHRELLERGGLTTFADRMSDLGDLWLGEPAAAAQPSSDAKPSRTPDALLNDLEQYIFSDGLYGSQKRRISNGLEKSGTAGYLIKRLILPYDTIKYAYPVLQKHKWLTPFYEVVRWTRVFKKNYRIRLMLQTDALLHTNEQDKEQSQYINEILGLGDI